LNQEIVIQVIAVLFVPLAVITAAVFGLAIISGVAGKVVLFVEDLTNLRDARRLTSRRVATADGASRTGVNAC
jgi:hypothetical protein